MVFSLRPVWTLSAVLVFSTAISACRVGSMDSTEALGRDNANCSDADCAGTQTSAPTEISAATSSTDLTSEPSDALELCGVGTCLPDDRIACAGATPPATVESNTPPSSTSPLAPEDRTDASIPTDAGLSDAGLLFSTDAGAQPTVAPGVDSGFAPSVRPDAGPQLYSCRIAVNGSNVVTRQCSQAGSQDVGEACSSASDCAPGLGCVGSAEKTRCLPYCCDLNSPCGENAYCTHRPLYDDSLSGGAPPPVIPVCEAVDGCSLSEPYPCPTGQDCSCGPTEACTVVRSDGATACTPPSPSAKGEGGDCPCLAGFICSQSSDGGSCRKLCSLDEQDSNTCGAGMCQTSGGLPPGWGTCVGNTPDAPP